MKKKLFTLLTLLLCVCSGAWADETQTIKAGTVSSGAFTYSSLTAYAYNDSYWAKKTNSEVIAIANNGSFTFTNAGGVTITGITVKGVAQDNGDQNSTITISDDAATPNSVTAARTGSETWANRQNTTPTTVAISSGISNLKMTAGTVYTVSNSGYKLGIQIEITYTTSGGGGGGDKTAAGLSYTSTSITKSIGDANFTNTLTNPNSLSVTYSITSNGTGSSINELTGEVTIGSTAGSETITAHSEEDETYAEGNATYTLNVQLIAGISLPSLPTGTYTGGNDVIHKDDKNAVVCDALGNAVMQASAPGYGSPTAANFTWANAYNGSDGSWSTTGDTWAAPTNSVFVGSSAYNTSENAHNVSFSRSCTIRPTRTFAYKFTNCVGVSALVKSASTTDATAAIMAVYKVVGSTHTLIESVSSKTGAVDILTVDGLTTTDTYVAYVYGMYSSGNGFLYEMAFLAPDNRTEVELSFSSNSESATVGLNFTEPTLSADPAAQLGLARYSSSNEDVATVNAETGEVTLKTAGSTTISAAIPINNTSYKSNTASYTLTVAAAPTTGTSVNAAQTNNTYYAVNGDASPSLSSTRTEVTFGNIIKVTGTNMQQGSQNFSIGGSNRTSFKVGTGNYVITPANNSITITAVKLYGFVNKDASANQKGQITTGGVAHDLNARDSGAENLVDFDLVANGEGNYAFSVTAPSSDYNGQDIIVLKVTYDITESVDVTVSSAGYATLYYGEKLAVPTGVTAYKAAVKDASTITITPIEGTVIPANTGVILKADEGTYNFVVTAEAAGDVTGNILTGTTTATTKEALGGTVFTLGQNSEGVVGLRNYTGTSIRAYSAYTTTVSTSRAFYPFSDDETTGINAVDTEAKEINDGVYYNLNGQRVTTPRKGLYIVNGKKVMVK